MNYGLRIKQIVLIIFAVLIVGGAGGILLERFVLPYFGILGPQAPIIITKREEIRINEGINNLDVVNRAKPALATIYLHEGKLGTEKFRFHSSLTGVVVTSDGVVVAPAAGLRPEFSLTVVLPDLKSYPAKLLVTDELMGLAFLKIEAADLSVVRQGFSQELQIGERLLAIRVEEGPPRLAARPWTLLRKSLPPSSLSQVYELGRPNAALETDLENPTELGAAVFNKDGQLVGFLVQFGKPGSRAEASLPGKQGLILRSEDLKLSLDNFLALATKQGKLPWPSLKISYLILDESQSVLLGLPKRFGVQVKAASKPLQPGDFIWAVADKELTGEAGFQQVLLAKQPGEKVKLRLIRDGEEMEVELGL